MEGYQLNHEHYIMSEWLSRDVKWICAYGCHGSQIEAPKQVLLGMRSWNVD